MEKLRKEIFIYEDISYRSLKEVYTEVFAKFCSLQNMEQERSAQSCFQALATEYNFTEQNIQRIIRIMTEEDPGEYFAKKRKLSKTETYNRNKAIFIDFLKWPGGRNEFCPPAAEKYGLSTTSVYQILHRCLYADTKRLDLL